MNKMVKVIYLGMPLKRFEFLNNRIFAPNNGVLVKFVSKRSGFGECLVVTRADNTQVFEELKLRFG